MLRAREEISGAPYCPDRYMFAPGCLLFVSLLLHSREQAMCSVGFCVINTLKRCYPLEDATHIALRKCVGKQHRLDGSTQQVTYL